MAVVKDLAITLRRLDYSETSQVLVVIGRQTGQQRLIARGIKRSTRSRTAVGIDLLEMGHVVFSRRAGSESQLATLTEWRQEDTFPNLRRSLAAMNAAQYAADRTAQMTEENDPHPALFDALRSLFEHIDARAPLAMLVHYLWALLRETGLMPELRTCTGCQTTLSAGGPVYFSSRQGGLLCRDCEPAYVEKRRVERSVLSVLAALVAEPPQRDSAQVIPAFELFDYHMTETLGKPSRVTLVRRGPAAPRP